MSNKDLLDNIKKLREMTGVGFKDCKIALDDPVAILRNQLNILERKIAKDPKMNELHQRVWC